MVRLSCCSLAGRGGGTIAQGRPGEFVSLQKAASSLLNQSYFKLQNIKQV
jgi:hypothetical protein